MRSFTSKNNGLSGFDSDDGAAKSAAVNTVAPALTGSPDEGATLSLSLGTWTGAVTHQRRYKRGGALMAGETGASVVVPSLSATLNIVGEVRAVDAAGIWSDWIPSNAVLIAGDGEIWIWEDGSQMAWEDGEFIKLEAA